MKRPVIVTDHALVRFLQRVGGLDTEGLRQHLADSLTRAVDAAEAIGEREIVVTADGSNYVIVKGRVVTVLDAGKRPQRIKRR